MIGIVSIKLQRVSHDETPLVVCASKASPYARRQYEQVKHRHMHADSMSM